MKNPALWHLYRKTNDETARDTLVRESIGLVHHIVRQMSRSYSAQSEYDELVSAGNVGLLQAVATFDPDRGFSFSTFAAQRIRGAILDEQRRTDSLSRSARRKCRSIADAERAVEIRAGRKASAVETAEELGVELETYWQWREYVEFDTPSVLGEAGGGALSVEELVGTAPSIEEQLDRESDVEILRDLILELPEQQRVVLTLSYFEGLLNSEIASVLELTPSRISQIRATALETLRERMRSGQ